MCVFIKYLYVEFCHHEIPIEYPWIIGQALEVYLIRIHEYEILYCACGDKHGLYISTTKAGDKSVTHLLISFNKYLTATNSIHSRNKINASRPSKIFGANRYQGKLRIMGIYIL